MLTQDEMWNVPHSSSDSPSPATVWMESQLDLNDRALAEMGKHPSSPDRDASGPAMKRARLSSEGKYHFLHPWQIQFKGTLMLKKNCGVEFEK